ncbi:hypothetical protein ACJJTC_011530 [Scirpophaga incertulas]
MNALMEFAALTKATLRTHEETCKNILRNYRRGTWGMPTSSAVLRDLLRKAEAAVYDNERGIVFMGTMLGSYMAAYSDTRGFVAARSDGAEEGMYDTAPDDPVVVVAKCTRVMLEGRILAMAETAAGGLLRGENPTSWTETTFTWINGVPGCGKTQVIISNINTDRDMVITTTTEAAEDLRAKLQYHNVTLASKKLALNTRALGGVPRKERGPYPATIYPEPGRVRQVEVPRSVHSDIVCEPVLPRTGATSNRCNLEPVLPRTGAAPNRTGAGAAPNRCCLEPVLLRAEPVLP